MIFAIIALAFRQGRIEKAVDDVILEQSRVRNILSSHSKLLTIGGKALESLDYYSRLHTIHLMALGSFTGHTPHLLKAICDIIKDGEEPDTPQFRYYRHLMTLEEDTAAALNEAYEAQEKTETRPTFKMADDV